MFRSISTKKMARVVVASILFSITTPFCEAEPTFGKWMSLSPMPTKRSEISAAFSNGRIYVPGGVSINGSLDVFEGYEIATNRWVTLAQLPTPLNHVGVSAYQGKVYISGGFEDLRQKKTSSVMHVYDIESDSFVDTIKMPGPRAKHSMIERDGWLHLIGGLDHRETWSLHLATLRWSSDRLPALPKERDHLSVLADSVAFYLVGGRKDEEGEDSVCLRYRFSQRESKWEKLSRIPTPTGGQMAALVNGRIHIVSGEDLQTKEVFSQHEVFDLVSGRWSNSEPLPVSRHGAASIYVNGVWYVIGGGLRSHIATIFSTTSVVNGGTFISGSQ
ncbi:MAG: hypothetical protein AAF226_02730 [Verrucomicrobiota bacterium]